MLLSVNGYWAKHSMRDALWMRLVLSSRERDTSSRRTRSHSGLESTKLRPHHHSSFTSLYLITSPYVSLSLWLPLCISQRFLSHLSLSLSLPQNDKTIQKMFEERLVLERQLATQTILYQQLAQAQNSAIPIIPPLANVNTPTTVPIIPFIPEIAMPPPRSYSIPPEIPSPPSTVPLTPANSRSYPLSRYLYLIVNLTLISL